MKKMNYSNFDESVEAVSAGPVEIVDSKTEGRQVCSTIANAISPEAAIVNVVNTALDTISDISKCITMVSIEKQRTKQAEVQAQVQIEESIQQTKRIKIQEKESTRKLVIQCETDLAKKAGAKTAA